MLASAAINSSSNKKNKKPPVGADKNKKPPVGVDTHMLGNRLSAAAGVGRRGADNKVNFPS